MIVIVWSQTQMKRLQKQNNFKPGLKNLTHLNKQRTVLECVYLQTIKNILRLFAKKTFIDVVAGNECIVSVDCDGDNEADYSMPVDCEFVDDLEDQFEDSCS